MENESVPGTLKAKLNYDLDEVAFLSEIPTKKKKRRKEVMDFKMKKGMGMKKDWNSETQLGFCFLPPLMRQISEYQSEKIPFNFRDQKVSEIYKKKVYVPKSRNNEVDKTIFLSKKEKKNIVSENFNARKVYIKEQEKKKRRDNIRGGFDLSTTVDKNLLKKNFQKTMEMSLKNTKKNNKTVKRKSLRQRYNQEMLRQRKLKTTMREELEKSI